MKFDDSITIDNRGTEEVPFGYVYLDGTRVGFSQGDGVWLTRGWDADQTHLDEAEEFLNKEMPGWNVRTEE